MLCYFSNAKWPLIMVILKYSFFKFRDGCPYACSSLWIQLAGLPAETRVLLLSSEVSFSTLLQTPALPTLALSLTLPPQVTKFSFCLFTLTKSSVCQFLMCQCCKPAEQCLPKGEKGSCSGHVHSLGNSQCGEALCLFWLREWSLHEKSQRAPGKSVWRFCLGSIHTIVYASCLGIKFLSLQWILAFSFKLCTWRGKKRLFPLKGNWERAILSLLHVSSKSIHWLQAGFHFQRGRGIRLFLSRSCNSYRQLAAS